MKRGHPAAPRRAGDGRAAELRAGRLRDHARPDGELEGKVVELQAFPSLYALMVRPVRDHGRGARARSRASIARLVDLLRRPRSRRVRRAPAPRGARGRGARVGRAARSRSAEPEDVPGLRRDQGAHRRRRGVPDGARSREGRQLYRARRTARLVQVRRIYNRIVFDELEAKNVELPVLVHRRPRRHVVLAPELVLDLVEVHAAVRRSPRGAARALRLAISIGIPDDLERYVLKPLFSFAGAGVKVDATRADIDAIPEAERGSGSSRRRSPTSPALTMPDGSGVKAEVRMMFLRAPDEPKPDARAQPRAAVARQDARRRSEQGSDVG